MLQAGVVDWRRRGATQGGPTDAPSALDLRFYQSIACVSVCVGCLGVPANAASGQGRPRQPAAGDNSCSCVRLSPALCTLLARCHPQNPITGDGVRVGHSLSDGRRLCASRGPGATGYFRAPSIAAPRQFIRSLWPSACKRCLLLNTPPIVPAISAAGCFPSLTSLPPNLET